MSSLSHEWRPLERSPRDERRTVSVPNHFLFSTGGQGGPPSRLERHVVREVIGDEPGGVDRPAARHEQESADRTAA